MANLDPPRSTTVFTLHETLSYLCSTYKTKTVLHYVRVKAIRVQSCSGSEGTRRLRLPDFKTIGT